MTEVWKYVSQNEMRRVDEVLQVVTLKSSAFVSKNTSVRYLMGTKGKIVHRDQKADNDDMKAEKSISTLASSSFPGSNKEN